MKHLLLSETLFLLVSKSKTQNSSFQSNTIKRKQYVKSGMETILSFIFRGVQMTSPKDIGCCPCHLCLPEKEEKKPIFSDAIYFIKYVKGPIWVYLEVCLVRIVSHNYRNHKGTQRRKAYLFVKAMNHSTCKQNKIVRQV